MLGTTHKATTNRNIPSVYNSLDCIFSNPARSSPAREASSDVRSGRSTKRNRSIIASTERIPTGTAKAI